MNVAVRVAFLHQPGLQNKAALVLGLTGAASRLLEFAATRNHTDQLLLRTPYQAADSVFQNGAAIEGESFPRSIQSSINSRASAFGVILRTGKSA
jgi:hypothetical protein